MRAEGELGGRDQPRAGAGEADDLVDAGDLKISPSRISNRMVAM
jgi:hypothetical protein